MIRQLRKNYLKRKRALKNIKNNIFRRERAEIAHLRMRTCAKLLYF